MRRSISGPLVVISIGVLFLLNNFYPDVFTFRSLFQYWPFLLIGLGVIRLIEVFVDAGQARPLAPSQLSGAGIVVIVLVCLLFGAISKGARSVHWRGAPFVHMDSLGMFGDEFDFDVQQSLPVSAADSRVVLEGLRGNVSLSGDDSSAITVTGHRIIHAFSHNAAAESNRKARLELVRSGNDIVLRSTALAELSLSYDIDVKLPRRMSLATQGTVENVTAEALDGSVDVAGDTGNVRLTSIGGDVRVETTRRKDLVRAVGIKGKVDLRGTGTDIQIEDVEGQVTIQGTYFGTLDFRNLAKPLHFESEQTDLRVEKLPGSISMDLGDFRAENITGPLRLRCESRDVHISNFSNDLEVNVQRGDIELSPQRTPLAKVDVHVRAGDIDLTLPEKGTFELHANTAQGEVDNQYGKGIAATSEGRAASMKSEAASGPPISITTDRGNITVKKS
jgi:DUF4097 and DUF4098 domain-containing protein YvlB